MARVGVHGRNDARWPEEDFELIRRARIETVKVLSYTEPGVLERVRQENPGIEFIVRLYDDRIGKDRMVSAVQFVDKMGPLVERLEPFTRKFEIHNEPNHVERIEGWGPDDEDAKRFTEWIHIALDLLERNFDLEWGFPGLAPVYPHRDLPWLQTCETAIKRCSWLGCHCYWQYGNMEDPWWGHRHTYYHDFYPKKPIEITEFGDSTPGRSRDEIAQLYRAYYHQLNGCPWVRSASAFIASSPDPTWADFVWRKDGGEFLPVVDVIGGR